MDRFKLPDRYVGLDKSVWEEYNKLDLEYRPVNLGQGFPNFEPPKDITDALETIASGENFLVHQYTRGYGHPRLVSVLKKLYSKILGRDVNAQTEIIVTNGAQQALYSAISGHLNIGDEVIIIEPYFDIYGCMVRQAGGVPKFIPLRFTNKSKPLISANDWTLDTEELTNLFNEKTKIIIINTPHNPLGKVFSKEELETVADLCKKWNVLCISDEVYEFLVYEPAKHFRISTIPGMWERTITVGSAGKTFSVTGWRVGWAYGGAKIMRNVQVVHQNCVYTCTTPIQEAVAVVLEKEFDRFGKDESYFSTFPNELKKKRDYMIKVLNDVGMIPTVPEGGYFVLADWSPLLENIDLKQESDKYKDYQFTKWMARTIGILGIPPSAFYSEPNKHLGENLVRYCFIKKDEDLKKAGNILQNWRNQSK